MGFGNAVAVDMNRAIVGARLHDGRKPDSGAVYAFSRVAGVWIEQSKTIHKKDAEADEFGNSVAISEDSLSSERTGEIFPTREECAVTLGLMAGQHISFILKRTSIRLCRLKRLS